MKKIVRLTESELVGIIRNIIKNNLMLSEQSMGDKPTEETPAGSYSRRTPKSCLTGGPFDAPLTPDNIKYKSFSLSKPITVRLFTTLQDRSSNKKLCKILISKISVIDDYLEIQFKFVYSKGDTNLNTKTIPSEGFVLMNCKEGKVYIMQNSYTGFDVKTNQECKFILNQNQIIGTGYFSERITTQLQDNYCGK